MPALYIALSYIKLKLVWAPSYGMSDAECQFANNQGSLAFQFQHLDPFSKAKCPFRRHQTHFLQSCHIQHKDIHTSTEQHGSVSFEGFIAPITTNFS